MYEIQIPEECLIVLCDECGTEHAPIRGCPVQEEEMSCSTC